MSGEQVGPLLTADQLRAVIRKDAAGAFGPLAEFADAHAVTTRLKHEALLFKYDRPSGDSVEGAAELEHQMLDLLSRIEADHAQHWNPQAVAERQAALAQLRAQLLHRPVAEPICVGRGLGKNYRRTDFHLRGVNLELRPGEVTGLVGQNANGKTTLLRMVAGELKPDEGSLAFPNLVPGKSCDWTAIKAQLAYLPQELPAWQGNLRDNLHFEAALHDICGEENERQVDFFVERLALRSHLHKRWSQLSGGTKLRFALARVLVWRPKILVLDEPLANLDVVAQGRLLQDLVDLARSPRYPQAVLLSSQHLHELEAVASSIIFLRGGAVEYNGPVEQVGRQQKYNVFELGTNAELAMLTQLFSYPHCDPPYQNGVSTVLKTPLEVGAREVLRQLQQADIAITYFRDISRSVKRLFQ